MLVVLSPAKRLTEGPAIAELPHTTPALLEDAAELAERARSLEAEDLSELMGISAKLATLNADRFARWTADASPEQTRQAARLFAGDTYAGLEAESLSAEDLSWAQDHVAILSGLYGVLRPLDLIEPYRLEMGTKLDNARGSDLYAFWGDRIGAELARRLEGHAAPVLVNCASNEYFSAVDLEALGARVITPVFQEVKDGKARVLSFFAKKARGRMARFVIRHRCTDPEQLKAFDLDGYRFDPDASEGDRWVFRRPQPPPVSKR